jgi:hypothetical protein
MNTDLSDIHGFILIRFYPLNLRSSASYSLLELTIISFCFERILQILRQI